MLLQSEKIMSTSTVDFNFRPAVLVGKISNFIHTLYLFTANDFATFVIPTALFAIFGTLAGPVLTTNTSPSILSTISRIPSAVAILWANLLIFNIANQRSPVAMEEDKINKPHRPLPRGLVTSEGATKVLFWLIMVVMFLGWVTNVWEETLVLFTLTWLYNDLGGSDEYWVLRNFFISAGYGLYSLMTLRALVGPEHTLTPTGFAWVFMITAAMFTTQHICDIKDAEGDRIRGRRSAPIILGDKLVRWTVSIPIVVFSLACSAFFSLGLASTTFTLAIGGLVAYRNLTLRDLKSDKLTWKLWALWTCVLFALPLVKNPDVFVQGWTALKTMFCQDGECPGALNLVAVSGVALVVEGRRVVTRMGAVGQENATVAIPDIRVNGAVVG